MDIASLCRCCLLRSPNQDLKTPQVRCGKTEVYCDMIKECFEIHLKLESNSGECGICELCIQRLRDACEFKQQVQQCQKVLYEIYGKEDIKVEVPNVKKEDPETYDAEYLDHDCLQEQDDDKSLAEFISMKDIKIKKKKSSSRKRNLGVIKIENSNSVKEEDDDNSLAEFLGLQDIKIKKKKSTDKKRNLGVIKIAKSNRSISLKPVKLKVIGEDIDITRFGISTNETKAFQVNLHNILKHSNCTPFSTKTIHGFSCAYCKNNYQDIQELRIHTQSVHKNEKFVSKKVDKSSLSIKIDITDLTCNICKEKLNLISDLKNHLMQNHGVKFYLDVFDYILEFKLSNSEILNCAICDSRYETFKMLLQHMNGHYRNFICDECDLGFLNRHKLINHKKTHEVGSFNCSFCDKVFTTRVRRACHEKYTHNDSARYTTNCPHCEKTFTSYYQRNRHMYTEHNTVAASYKCNICDKSFILKSKLTSHIKKVHLMERDHICPECGQGFFVRKSLEDHMVRHNGERVYKCTVCLKAYARKKTLREHMRIHNNDRRFKCGVCALAFVQKCSLKSHMLSNHGVTLESYEKSKCENASVEVI